MSAAVSDVTATVTNQQYTEERSVWLHLEWADYDKAPTLPMDPDRPWDYRRPNVLPNWTPRSAKITYRRSTPDGPWYFNAVVTGMDTGFGVPARTFHGEGPKWLTRLARMHVPEGGLQ